MKKEKLMSEVFKGLLMATVVAAGVPHLAFAQNLGNSVTTVIGNLTNIPDIIAACFYIGGAAFTGSGLLKLKQHAENPTQTALGHGVGRIGVGAGLLALPFIANSMIQTFGFNGAAAGYTTFTKVQ